MSCKDILEDLSAYADGELEDPEAEVVKSHLEGCVVCRKVLAEYGALDALLRSDAGTEPSPGFLQGVRGRVSGATAARPTNRLVMQPRRPVAASVLLLLGLVFLGNRELADDEGGKSPSTTRVEPTESFAEVESAVAVDPELLEILNNLEALERIELLENLPILERMEEFQSGEADDLSKAAEVLIPEEELPLEGGE